MRPLRVKLRTGELRGELLTALAYPSGDPEYAKLVLGELIEMGVEEVEFQGRSSLPTRPELKVLGKGTTSIILKVRGKHGWAAAKVLRSDSNREDVRREASCLSLANSVRVGPKLLDFRRRSLLMELIGGVTIREFLSSPPEPQVLREVILELLHQAFRLDKIGLDHGELSRAGNHVLIEEDFGVKIIDFESASTMRKPSNLSSIIQYLIFRKGASRTFEELGIEVRTSSLIDSLRKYKREINEGTFEEILKSLGLNRL